MASAINLATHTFSVNDKFIVDTNIWIYLFSPFNSGGDRGYSNFLASALLSSSVLYINDLIVSEYINRLCRIGYRNYARINNLNLSRFEFKRHYQPTQDFEDTYSMALQSLQQEIFPITTYLPSDEEILNECINNVKAKDFNDDVLIRTAIKNGYSIVSHDGDFRNSTEDFTTFHY